MRFPHPSSANKKKAVEVLAAVFGGGTGRIAGSQTNERESIVTPMSENWIVIDFKLELY